jgi:hypothetical protein
MRPFSLLISIFLFPLIAMFLFSCASPTDPYGKDKTTLSLVGIDSRQFTDTISIKDSVGNVFSVGFSSNLPMNLDSVELKLVVPDSKDSLLKTFYKLTNLKFSDISWNSMSFSDTGTKMIYGVAYINNYPSKIPSDTIKVIIYGKPPNFKPSITIAGLTTISIGQQFNLMVTATDTDKAQTIIISLLKAPSGAVFSSAGLFLWTPPQDFFGTDTAIFIAKDNGYPIMSDTARVVIRVIDPSNNHAPKWQKDTINEVGRPGVPITVTLSDKCMDPDGDELTYSLLSGTPDGNAIVVTNGSAVYTFTPGPADTGALYSRMIAKDPKGASDTLTIALNIHVPGVDILPPIMKLVSPAGDSASVSSNALSIKIQCTDVSGVASVKCSMGVDTFTISNTDSTYTAAIVGLKSGLNIISFIATDASLSTNKDTFFVHIKYDSTIADNVAPIVRISSPSKDTVVGIDSCIIKIVSKDPSGVASVQWKIDAILFPATKSPTADSVWSATVKGLLPGTSTVTVIATDASPAANKDSAILHIKYDNDKTAPTLKLFSPAKDSASVSGNAIVIQVVCKDPSGVASITYGMGSGSPQPMTKSASADSLWSANVTGLVPGYNTIRIIAVDSTLTANRDTLLLHILYDTTTTTNPKPSWQGSRTVFPLPLPGQGRWGINGRKTGRISPARPKLF